MQTPSVQRRAPAAPAPFNGLLARLAWASAAGSAVQPKLAISQPGDPLEHEADRVADAVVSGAVPGGDTAVSQASPAIQRKCAACGAGGGACPQCESQDGLVQRKAEPGPSRGEVPSPGLATGAGGSLSPALRAYFEPRFGRDFSRVRLHTGPDADAAAGAIGARAFTIGPDVVLAGGSLDTGSKDGVRLLAHELAHTAQQGMAPVTSGATLPISAAPRLMIHRVCAGPLYPGCTLPTVGSLHGGPHAATPCCCDETTIAARSDWCRDTGLTNRQHAPEQCYRRIITPTRRAPQIWPPRGPEYTCPPSEQYCFSTNSAGQAQCHSSPDSVGFAIGKDASGSCVFDPVCMARHVGSDVIAPGD